MLRTAQSRRDYFQQIQDCRHVEPLHLSTQQVEEIMHQPFSVHLRPQTLLKMIEQRLADYALNDAVCDPEISSQPSGSHSSDMRLATSTAVQSFGST